MSSGVIYNNNVLNQGGTPALITFNGFPTPGFVGRILYNSNDHKIYQDTGSAWVAYGGGTGTPQFPIVVQDAGGVSTTNNNILNYNVTTGPNIIPIRVSGSLNVLYNTTNNYLISLNVRYIDLTNTLVHFAMLVMGVKNQQPSPDRSVTSYDILPYPNTNVEFYISTNNPSPFAVAYYCCVEQLSNGINYVIPSPPMLINASNYSSFDLIDAIFLINSNAITNLYGVTILANSSVLGYTNSYNINNNNVITLSNGNNIINVLNIYDYTTSANIPYTVANNGTLTPSITLYIDSTIVNDGIGIDFSVNSIMTVNLQNQGVQNYNSLTTVLNSINVSGLTFVTLSPSQTKSGSGNNAVVGANTFFIQSTSGQSVTVNNVVDLNSGSITYSVINNGTTFVTINATLTSLNIAAGILIEIQ